MQSWGTLRNPRRTRSKNRGTLHIIPVLMTWAFGYFRKDDDVVEEFSSKIDSFSSLSFDARLVGFGTMLLAMERSYSFCCLSTKVRIFSGNYWKFGFSLGYGNQE
mmetsp:Transcript_32257/g.78457  ORF Transcript_32257/g.78457 Transcript_32257/m.78457 type:complete len:105 (+) Transcript_32257:215-529(+)